jgi:predicted metalloprotease with PDZ domain
MQWLRFFLFFAINTQLANAQVHYALQYLDSSSGKVQVTITFTQPLDAPADLIMPRSVPGAYNELFYDHYVVHPVAMSVNHKEYVFIKGEGPRWKLPKKTDPIQTIYYEVDVKKMEQQQLWATDYSVLRSGYGGILNYSVFGWVEGTEEQAIQCTIQTFPTWKIYSTIQPKENPDRGKFTFSCTNYFLLADGQTCFGTALQLKKFDGLVPLYVVSYSEKKPEYLEDIGWFGTTSMQILKDYFKDLPFDHYTIIRHSTIFPDSNHIGGFAMEHLNSMTAGGNEHWAVTASVDSASRFQRIFAVLHHMSHAYLPLRCYGDTYLPHVKEIPPIIKNIWFNEGFIWFLCYDTLKSPAMWNRLTDIVYKGDEVIRRMPLLLLSEEGSTMYASDFRIGQALFSRGAMMAFEMNSYIKSKSNGSKSMRDVFRYLYQWSKQSKRAFTLDEFTGLLRKATGIDVTFIYEKWLGPVNAH